MPPELTDTDAELLSAYLDGMLTDSEQTALEKRLTTEPVLRRELAALRQTIELINALPPLKAPRSFILSPEMVALPATETVEPSPAMLMKKVVVMPVAPPKRVRPRGWQPAAFAAAAVFIVAVGFALMLNTMSPASAPPQVASQPTENPVFSNMVTGSQPVEPQEPDTASQAAQGTTSLAQPLPQPTTAEIAQEQADEEQSQAGGEAVPPAMSAIQATFAPTQIGVTGESEQTVDVMRYDATILPEGMGGGVPVQGGEVQDGFAGGQPEPVQSSMAANEAVEMSATRVAVNTDPNAPGFSVRPADEPADTDSSTGNADNGLPETGLLNQTIAPAPQMTAQKIEQTVIQRLAAAITGILERLNLPGARP